MGEKEDLHDRISEGDDRSMLRSYYPKLRKQILEHALFKTMIDQTNDLMILTNKSDGEIIYRNSVTEYFFNCGEKTIKRISDYLGKRFWRFIKKSSNKRIDHKRITFNQEITIQGEPKVLEINIDDILFEEEYYFLFVIKDISYRVLVENQVRISERNFKNIFNNSGESIVIFSLENMRILNANRTFLERMKYNISEAIQLKPFDIIVEDDHKLTKERINKIINGEQLSVFETEAIAKDGESIPIEISTTLIDYYNQKALLSMVRDISERRKYEQRLFETMIEAEEIERKRMAEDLHDEIGPLLSTLNMYISALPTIKENSKRDEFLKKVSTIVQDTTTSVRQISNALSPHLLSNFGLHAAVKTIVDQTRNVISINYRSNLHETRFQSTIEVIFYRICKELINNTLKHADAHEIDIELKHNTNLLALSYADDGIGFDFDTEMKPKKSGIGLFNIISRVHKIGGKYSFKRNSPTGIKFKLELKLTNAIK